MIAHTWSGKTSSTFGWLVSTWRPNSSNFSNFNSWPSSLRVLPIYRTKVSAILSSSGYLSPSYDVSSSCAWWRKCSCAGFAPRHRTICTIRQTVGDTFTVTTSAGHYLSPYSCPRRPTPTRFNAFLIKSASSLYNNLWSVPKVLGRWKKDQVRLHRLTPKKPRTTKRVRKIIKTNWKVLKAFSIDKTRHLKIR